MIYMSESAKKMRIKKSNTALVIVAGVSILILMFSLTGCSEDILIQKTEDLMGTFVEIIVNDSDEDIALDMLEGAFDQMRKVYNLMNRYDEESQLSLVNKNAGIKPVKVDPWIIEVIERSLVYSDLTGGSFDITINPLMDLWGFYSRKGKIPSDEEIIKTRGKVDYHRIEISHKDSTVFLKEKGMALDLGAIAKGYAVDKTCEYLKSRNPKGALINAGGDIYAFGKGRSNRPWRIGVRNPINKSILLILSMNDYAVVTSGCYERYLELDGTRYCHIIDAKTGRPVKSVESVTIIAPNPTDADALATSVLLLGPEKGLELISNQPDCEALIIYHSDESPNGFKIVKTKDFYNYILK